MKVGVVVVVVIIAIVFASIVYNHQIGAVGYSNNDCQYGRTMGPC